MTGPAELQVQLREITPQYDPRTAKELASLLRSTEWGVTSALRSMQRRAIVRQVKPRAGESAPRWKLRDVRS